MIVNTCKSCGGTYTHEQPGGYYHACPDYKANALGVKIPILNPRDENPNDHDPTYLTQITAYNALAADKQGSRPRPLAPATKEGAGVTVAVV